MNSRPTQQNSNTVLTFSEFHHLRSNASNPDNNKSGTKYHKEKHTKLRNMSIERSSKWTNTLSALHKQKERESLEQKADAEQQLKELDLVEEQIRNEKRLVMLKRAEIHKQENNSDVRQLKSKLMLCDIQHIRNQQISLKKHRQQMEKQLENEYVATVNQSMQKFDKKERDKFNQTRALNQETICVIKQQLAKKQQQNEQEKENIKKEYRQSLAIQHEEQQKLEQTKRNKILKIQKTKQERNLYLADTRKQKERRKLQEQQEDEHIQQFHQEKERIGRIRNQKKQDRIQELHDRRQTLIDLQTKHLEQIQSEKQSQERQPLKQKSQQSYSDKQDALQREKQQKNKQLLQECIAECANQKQSRIAEKKLKIMDDKILLQAANQQFDVYEKQKLELEKTRKHKAKKFAQYQKQQIIEKRRRELCEKQSERMHAQKVNNMHEQQQKQISKWAQNKIQQYEKAGLNVKHLK